MQGWANVPGDVLSQSIEHLSKADRRNVGQVCNAWGHAVLQVFYSETWLKANKADLIRKVHAVCRRAQRTSHVHFKIRLSEKLCMRDFATTLQSLVDQVWTLSRPVCVSLFLCADVSVS